MEPIAWPYPIVRLKPGKEVLLSKGHPWVYSGALAEAPSSPLVRLADAAGQVLGVGTASPSNALAVRLFRRAEEPLDRAFFQSRLEHALAGRPCSGWTARRPAAAGFSGKGICCPAWWWTATVRPW